MLGISCPVFLFVGHRSDRPGNGKPQSYEPFWGTVKPLYTITHAPFKRHRVRADNGREDKVRLREVTVL
jgi:hypothetical protein